MLPVGVFTFSRRRRCLKNELSQEPCSLLACAFSTGERPFCQRRVWFFRPEKSTFQIVQQKDISIQISETNWKQPMSKTVEDHTENIHEIGDSLEESVDRLSAVRMLLAPFVRALGNKSRPPLGL